MKTIIFFLALYSSFWTIVALISRYVENIKGRKGGVITPVVIFGLLPIALWTYYHYL